MTQTALTAAQYTVRVTLEEFISAPRPDVLALMIDTDGSPLVAKCSLTLLGARGGKGKTTLAVAWCIHAALGADYLGFGIPEPVTVLLIENEGPQHLFAEKTGGARRATLAG
jgi:hypothetical protein